MKHAGAFTDPGVFFENYSSVKAMYYNTQALF